MHMHMRMRRTIDHERVHQRRRAGIEAAGHEWEQVLMQADAQQVDLREELGCPLEAVAVEPLDGALAGTRHGPETIAKIDGAEAARAEDAAGGERAGRVAQFVKAQP